MLRGWPRALSHVASAFNQTTDLIATQGVAEVPDSEVNAFLHRWGIWCSES